MREDDDKESRDDGSIWTSYSDMFTTMAIIFLVMFVFAMIKLGVSSIQNIAEQKKHKSELEGMITEKEKKKNQKKISQIKKTINQAKNYKDVIKNKIDELQNFASKIDENEKIMNDLVNDQEKKTALLNKVSVELKERKKDLEISFNSNKMLNQQLKTARTNISKNNREIYSLENVLKKKVTNIEDLQENIKVIEQIKAKKEHEIIQLSKKISKQGNEKTLLKSEITNYQNQKKMLDSDIDQLKEVVQTKNSKIQDLDEMAVEYRKQIENTIQKNRELMNNVMDKETEIASSKVRESGLNSEVKRLDKDSKKLEKFIGDLSIKKTSITSKLEVLRGQHTQLQVNYNSAVSRNKNLNKEVTVLKNQMIDKTSEISGYQQVLADMKGRNANMDNIIKNLQDKNMGLVGQNRQLENKNRAFEELTGKMNGKDRSLQTKNRALASVNSKMRNDIHQVNSELAACEEKNSHLSVSNLGIKDDIKYVKKKVQEANTTLRTSLAKKLAKKFKDANIDVFVDLKTGTISLMTGNNLLFKSNSHKLNRRAKKLLKKLIPLYAEVLFEDSRIAKKISSFNVDGHASPTFQGRYVSLKKHNHKAYSYNLDLSGRRATSIAKYVFGGDTKRFKHKTRLRNLTKSTGYGYSVPKKKVRRKGKHLASSRDTCGPYDCSKSQRVELGFTLEDDLETINKIMELKARKQ